MRYLQANLIRLLQEHATTLAVLAIALINGGRYNDWDKSSWTLPLYVLPIAILFAHFVLEAKAKKPPAPALKQADPNPGPRFKAAWLPVIKITVLTFSLAAVLPLLRKFGPIPDLYNQIEYWQFAAAITALFLTLTLTYYRPNQGPAISQPTLPRQGTYLLGGAAFLVSGLFYPLEDWTGPLYATALASLAVGISFINRVGPEAKSRPTADPSPEQPAPAPIT